MITDSGMTRGLCFWTCLLALAGGLATIAGSVLYARYGTVLLTQGDNRVARLYVVEAERAGNAGEPEKALALYDRAFEAGFSYPPDKSRTFAMKGRVLWGQGRVRDAVETLSAAVSGSAPDFRGAHALVEALLHLKRLDEAQSVVRRWRESLGNDTTPQTRADTLYCAGRVAQERGDEKGARAAYEESAALAPGELAAYRLGVLCAQAANFAEARRHLESFLLGGASGDEAARARELLCTPESSPVAPK